MNAKEIIAARLKELGADGLCRKYYRCGEVSGHCECSVDSIAHYCCDLDILKCVPAKKIKDSNFYNGSETCVPLEINDEPVEIFVPKTPRLRDDK